MKKENTATATRHQTTRAKSRMGMLLGAAALLLQASFFCSCSEDSDTEYEFENWQQRNDTYFASLQDSLKNTPAGTTWLKMKSFSKNPADTIGTQTDYIYVKVLQEGIETSSPMFTDSVRISYQGRLIPSSTYPEGYIFDTTVYGTYDAETNATKKMLTSSMIDGFTTALLHMHRGDTWRVYIPYALGYSSTSQTTIPAYSTLIFDITLVDFSPAGQAMPAWSSRRR